jgi:putative transposase
MPSRDWLKERQIKTLYIRPGSPWENAHIESFHDKLRDECLNRELFGTLAEARVIVEIWRVEYNQERPHSSLDNQTPEEFARSKFGLPSRPPASFRPNLQRLNETGFIRPNNRQNYAYKVSSNWGQASVNIIKAR